MHSLKNTIIAVGLLGLSFVFYQASSSSSKDSDEMVPALEISDGTENLSSLATERIDAAAAKIGTLPPIQMPKIDSPKFAEPNKLATDFGSGVSAKTSSNPFPAKAATSGPSGNHFPSGSQPESKFSNSNDFAGSASFDASMANGSNGFPPSTQNSRDPEVRDQGLIDALKTQQPGGNQFTATPSPTNNHFIGHSGADEARSQPIPSSDSSYNALATDLSKKSNADVMHADSEPDPANLNFQSAWPHVDKLIAEKNYRDALRLLSRYYRSTDLTGPQRQRLIGWLDALAGKVIFSAEHHLQQTPYTVANESLDDIGKRWKVPGQLIYNINQQQIPNPGAIAAGTQLKVVQGPFDAEIDTKQNVMTLFLGDLYAGRYPIRVGISGEPKPGNFRVLVKSPVGHDWRDAQGNSYPPGSPENGYGPNWIGLSGSLCIHEVEDSMTQGHRGCIGLNRKDANDVYAILADGSNVKILR